MSVLYRSTVADMSVNWRWHIGQLSVAYQSCVNLAGESNGFPFERSSNFIMLLRKMLQCKARLHYEANRWALRTMGMVIFSFVPIVSSIGQVSAKCWSSIGQESVKYRPSVGEVSVRYWWPEKLCRPTYISTDHRPTINWVATESQSSVDRQPTEWRSSIDRVSTATSTDITFDIAVNITYSKHDPRMN